MFIGCSEPGVGRLDGPTVRFTTTMGAFAIGTYASDSPVTTDNFVQYAEDGFYDGADGGPATLVHRVVPGFVVQGGGVTPDGDSKPTRDPIPNESTTSELLNFAGTVAMARFSEPDTATSQWFVNLVDNPTLDPGPDASGYAVFGEVVSGFEVITAIESVPLTGDQPIDPIVIEAVAVEP
jgi:peptidyl-prolyl cis-trans isomerase A (cyclophilin A)